MVAAAALCYGVGPIANHGQALAEWIVHGLVPWLIVLVAALYVSLLRATLRCPVRVYVGNDPQMQRVVTRCPSFQKDYRPPAWAAGAWAQAVLYLYRSWRNQHMRGVVREELELPDGELVHLFWMLPPCCQRDAATFASSPDGSLSETDAPVVPPSVPIVVICHGVFQSATDLYEFCTFLTNECGYLPCVFSRRGIDTPLSRPRFNTVGDQEDFRFILSRIRGRFPLNRMYGVGISAGSSLLARYLGDAGADAELDGGVLVSPGYDMEKSLRHMTPFADMVITFHAKSFFLTRNKDTLASENRSGLKKLYRSRSMHEFHQHLHVFDGKASSEEYFNTHNPSQVLDKIRKPIVYINAYDDMCFPGDFTFQFKNLVDRCRHATVLHLERGGHGTFYEGWDAGTSRFFQVVREFVDCLHNEQFEESVMMAAGQAAEGVKEGEAVATPAAAAAVMEVESPTASLNSSRSSSMTLKMTTLEEAEEEVVMMVAARMVVTTTTTAAQQEQLQEEEQQEQSEEEEEEEGKEARRSSLATTAVMKDLRSLDDKAAAPSGLREVTTTTTITSTTTIIEMATTDVVSEGGPVMAQ